MTSALYQHALLKEHQTPVGFNKVLINSSIATGVNPACGDHIEVAITGDHKVDDIAFYGDSCAICRASASLMCQRLTELSRVEAMVKVEDTVAQLSQQQMFSGLLAPLNAVFAFPIRIQCALLPWQTLKQALEQQPS